MPEKNIHIIGVDSGGTFTDFIYYNGHILTTCKVLSTPQAPERAILQGLQQLGAPLDKSTIIHGSTVATNAVLEGKGARTALVTNRGFADMLTIGRQTRSALYALEPTSAAAPVPAELCFEIGARIDASGNILCEPDRQQLAALSQQIRAAKVEAVAINLLFSFVDSRHEQAIAKALPAQLFISCSSAVLAEYKEYERGVSTWLNAFVGPVIKRYLTQLASKLPNSSISIMQSSGGIAAIDHCADHGVRLLLSGPAGGLAAARHIAKQCHISRLLSLDMGGTSTDVALIDGELQLTTEGRIGSYPVAVAMVDIHTIGAGGGSIAWVDEGGLLQVGPQSAGADPGPACYGNVGTSAVATLTDANLVLGKLPRDTCLAGDMALDYDAAAAAIHPLSKQLGLSIADTAAGIVVIAEQHMSTALRQISIQRGHDPRQFCISSFGGAGGLHVCALADSLGIVQAIIPHYAGVLSAFGMLVAPCKELLSRTLLGDDRRSDQNIERAFAQLVTQAQTNLRAQGFAKRDITVQRSVDMRYQGQSFTLNVDWLGLDKSSHLFQDKHQQRYGHRLNHDVELVTIRVTAIGPEPSLTVSPIERAMPDSRPIKQTNIYQVDAAVPVYQRQQLSQDKLVVGPAIICETMTTSYIAPKWQARLDKHGHLRLSRHHD